MEPAVIAQSSTSHALAKIAQVKQTMDLQQRVLEAYFEAEKVLMTLPSSATKNMALTLLSRSLSNASKAIIPTGHRARKSS